MNFIQIKELVEIANLNFRKLTLEEHQKKIVLGNKTKLETISDKPLTKQLSPQEETLTDTEIKGTRLAVDIDKPSIWTPQFWDFIWD